MRNKNILALVLIIAMAAVTAVVTFTQPEMHKTFEIQILKFVKVDK